MNHEGKEGEKRKEARRKSSSHVGIGMVHT
jgi:hypothetical protein